MVPTNTYVEFLPLKYRLCALIGLVMEHSCHVRRGLIKIRPVTHAKSNFVMSIESGMGPCDAQFCMLPDVAWSGRQSSHRRAELAQPKAIQTKRNP